LSRDRSLGTGGDMQTDCRNYERCRQLVQACNKECEGYNRTCWDCIHRVENICGKYGYEGFIRMAPCNDFVREKRANPETVPQIDGYEFAKGLTDCIMKYLEEVK